MAGSTVAVPQAEMGQGIWSGLAQIVADELGADWRTVAVEPAPLGPDYANKGMMIDQIDHMSGAMRSLAAWAGGRMVEYFDFQITGGSTSVRGFEAPLRAAGAAGARNAVPGGGAALVGRLGRLRHGGRFRHPQGQSHRLCRYRCRGKTGGCSRRTDPARQRRC